MSLLIPVRLPQESPLVDGNVRELAGFDVVLFGYWETPEGADPSAVREEHEPEAQAELYDLAARFSRAGASTDIRLKFGPASKGMTDLQTEIPALTDVDAVVIPDRITLWNNVLVPLRDDRNADRIVEFLSAFDRDSMFALELFHVAGDQGAVEDARDMLDGVRSALLEEGFSETDLEVTVTVASDPNAAIVERATGHNVVVIGESEEQTDTTKFLGRIYEHVAEDTDVPVVVVRNRG